MGGCDASTHLGDTDSVVIGGAGDIACQLLIDNDREFSFRRLFNMAFLGAVLVAPCLHVWYALLSVVEQRQQL